MENCIALDVGGEILVKNGFARPVSTAEALKILEQCKEMGLAQTGDNMQKNAAYICNCCGCCCNDEGRPGHGSAQRHRHVELDR